MTGQCVGFRLDFIIENGFCWSQTNFLLDLGSDGGLVVQLKYFCVICSFTHLTT